MEEITHGFNSPTAAKKWRKLIEATEEAKVIPPCQQTDPEAWFTDDMSIYMRAKAMCKECPVQALCADFAIENKEPHGVWGGLSPKERSRIRSSMGHTRGRKKAA
jgi:phage terminase small subunit